MKKNIYYYNSKFPEYGINKFIVLDEYYEINGKGNKWLVWLETKYDVNTNRNAFKWEMRICMDYDNDKIMYHNNVLGNQIVLSYDREALKELWLENLKRTEGYLKNRMEAVENARFKEDNKRRWLHKWLTTGIYGKKYVNNRGKIEYEL